MNYNKKERRELRFQYLRMLLRLQGKLDEARMALIMSVADMYFNSSIEEDKNILDHYSVEYSEEVAKMEEFNHVWSKRDYEKGRVEGWEVGREEGREEGIEEGRSEVILKLLNKGFSPEAVAEALGSPLERIKKLMK